MDNCIYHSKDLDGLMSGAIVHNYQTSYWEPCTLHPYDYGESLDTRRFKGKTTVMIDVSMPMDRMELLGLSCMEFMWIDHHVSAYNDLTEYCIEMGYPIEIKKINDLITCIEVKKMNMIYYYSSKLSGCELTAILFDKNLSKTGKKVIQLLGQYDTWREFPENQFVNDEDWNEITLPFQYGMRAQFNNPVKISDYLEHLKCTENVPMSGDKIKPIIDIGKFVIDYQVKLDETNMAANSFEMDFDFDGKVYKAICLNSTVFNSNVFKSVYFDQYHDLMIAFQYSGKKDKYKFSIYTTKEEVNILGIAKSFGGGGHKKACGFEISAEQINIEKKVISIFNNRRKDKADKNVGFLEFLEDEDPLEEKVLPNKPHVNIPPIVEKKIEFPKLPKGYLYRVDEQGRFYWIALHLSKKFETAVALTIGENSKKDLEIFENEYLKYQSFDGKCPEFLLEKLKHKL